MNRTNVIRAASVGKECLNAALALAMSGLPVFPCTATKAPACPGGFKTATCAPDAVLEIFTRYPSPLIGVRTGSDSRLSVLDLDAKHPEARAWWSEHRSCLPVTRAHRTRSGGLHLLYEHCSGVKCTAGKIAPGVDTRGEGGYIIWWPAAGWPVLTESPLAPWPKSLLKRYETQAGGGEHHELLRCQMISHWLDSCEQSLMRRKAKEIARCSGLRADLEKWFARN